MTPRLVFVLGFAMSSCGHDPGPGVRNGVRGDADDPTLADLALTVNARQVAGRPLEIAVYLERPGARRDACFTVDAGYRVTVDGHPARLASPGGLAAPMHASGLEWRFVECDPAAFVWSADAATPPASRIVVEHAGGRAEASIAHLRTRRALRMLPSDHVRPGDRVTLEWTPATDEWPDALGVSIHLYAPGEDLAPGAGNARPLDRDWVDRGGSLEGRVEKAPPRFRFTMPAVRPGPLRLGLSFNPYTLDAAHPDILSCKGLARCAATVNNGPDDLTIDVR